MKNPFIQHEKSTNARKRNAFDLSLQNNLSLPIGAEIPVLCKEAVPGDSFRIKAGAFLRAWPTVFPVQTPIKMTLHLFKVYNRTLQTNFMDMVYNNREDIVHPYISQPSSFYNVGGLAERLGVPVVKYDNTEYSATFSTSLFKENNYCVDWEQIDPIQHSFTSDNGSFGAHQNMSTGHFIAALDSTKFVTATRVRSLKSLKVGLLGLRALSPDDPAKYNARFCLYCRVKPSNLSPYLWIPIYFENDYHSNFVSFSWDVDINMLVKSLDNFTPLTSVEPIVYVFALDWFTFNEHSDLKSDSTLKFDYVYDDSHGISIAEGAYNPYVNDIHLNALPFRAYEAIHNSFYRDPLNDPWYLDGQPQYNNYVTTKADGADTTPYHIFYRNWEKDFLTSAYPSPQQGLAPLVGISSRGEMKFEMEDGSTRTVQATFADDNETIVGFKMSKDVMDDPVLKHSVMDVVSQGISINNLRDVGALQRWLEANQRGRYRYRDQVFAHTGVKIDFDELDMPEFVGGYSRVVNTAQINNTSAQGDAPLGAFGGQLSFFNSMEHSISTFFKEHGWLIGILTITPVPCYSQLLPKHFLKDNPLSYFNTEFAHIGMQPITYKEVCPLQVHDQQVVTYNDTFGYQRPWYDLIASVDEVHGQMLTTLRDFVMNRTFSGVPYLNGDFLHIDPNQVNQVFTYTDGSSDTFFGQIVFDIVKKTQVPRSGIPMLQA